MEIFNYNKSNKFCRLCLRDNDLNLSELSSEIQDLFFELTQTKLNVLATNNFTCFECTQNLIQATNTKRAFIENQKQFENELKNNEGLKTNEELTQDTAETLESSKLSKHLTSINTNQSFQKAHKKRRQCVISGLLVKNLQEHVKITHSKIKRYFCDFCSYSCYFKTKIARHIQKHIPKSYRELFRCSEKSCQFQCSRKDALKSHTITMHQIDRKRNFSCKNCEKSFFNRSQLSIHTKAVHDKIRTNTCPVCGKCFYNAKDLSFHETRHSEKKEKCNECGALFYCIVDLRRHIKNRHTPASIACEYPDCGKKFHSNSKLKAHVKTRHENLKEFLCNFCESTFSQFNNLKRHIDSIHKALRISCVISNCNYSVSRKDKYKNHLLSQHKFLDKETRNCILKESKLE